MGSARSRQFEALDAYVGTGGVLMMQGVEERGVRAVEAVACGTLQAVAGGYRWLQVVTGGYRWLQVVTGGDRWLQVVTGR